MKMHCQWPRTEGERTSGFPTVRRTLPRPGRALACTGPCHTSRPGRVRGSSGRGASRAGPIKARSQDTGWSRGDGCCRLLHAPASATSSTYACCKSMDVTCWLTRECSTAAEDRRWHSPGQGPKP